MPYRPFMSRRRLLLGCGVLAAFVLAVAPVHCSQGSDDDRPSCTTVFGYSSLWP